MKWYNEKFTHWQPCIDEDAFLWKFWMGISLNFLYNSFVNYIHGDAEETYVFWIDSISQRKDDDLEALPTVSPGNAVSVMAPWSTEHRPVIGMEPLFRGKFNAEHQDPIKAQNTILR